MASPFILQNISGCEKGEKCRSKKIFGENKESAQQEGGEQVNLSDQVKALETVKDAYHRAFCEIWATIHVETNAKEPIEKLRSYINEWNLTLTNLGETGMPPINPPNKDQEVGK